MRRWAGLAAMALWAALVSPTAGEAQPAGQEWTPGDVFKDCAECPEMVVWLSGLTGHKYRLPPLGFAWQGCLSERDVSPRPARERVWRIS